MVWKYISSAFLGGTASSVPLSASTKQIVANYLQELPLSGASSPLTQRLQTAFHRNQSSELDRLLAGLPAWPITHHTRQTASVLIELKRSIYRAKAEGVPNHIIQRYLNNIAEASNSVWQLASKLDALAQQKVAYVVVAQRLDQEMERLVQLQHSAQAAQNGIAVLIVAGIQSDAVQRADEDFADLTSAVIQLLQIDPKYATAAIVRN